MKLLCLFLLVSGLLFAQIPGSGGPGLSAEPFAALRDIHGIPTSVMRFAVIEANPQVKADKFLAAQAHLRGVTLHAPPSRKPG